MDHRTIKEELYSHFARIGKAFASPKRLEIIDLLSQGPRSVEEIARETHLSVGNASAHLKQLHGARVLDRQRDGQRIFYQITSPAVFELFRDLQRVGERQIAEIDRLLRLYYSSPDELDPVSPDELLRRLSDDDVLVLDIRPDAEYRLGHLPGAINVPPAEIQRRIRDLPRDREIVAYCRGPYCLFSVDAIATLQAEGYRARRLDVGFPDWVARGFPIEALGVSVASSHPGS